MVQVKNMKQRSYIMLYFENDYCEGAHEAILKRLMETNLEKVPGYGQDPFCDKAKEMLMKREQLNLPDIKFFPFPRTMVKFLPQI